MGTSVSQRSPRTSNWRAVEAGYTKEEIPVQRLTQEIWRAAINQEQGNLFQDLAAPIVATCLRIVQETPTREDAVQRVRRTVALSGQKSLATEIAQRAVVQTYMSREDRTNAFTKSLFSEAGNYLVSRDISGFIGSGRINNVSDAIALKNDIKRHIVQVVGEVQPPAGDLADVDIWRNYVSSIVRHFSGGIP
jgi:hypothetical protein